MAKVFDHDGCKSLLTKLFFEANAGADGVMGWYHAMPISTYTTGWQMLHDSGHVEFLTEADVYPELFAGQFHKGELIVRFTDKGLEYAIERNVPKATRDAMAGKLEAVAVQRNEDRPGFGEF